MRRYLCAALVCILAVDAQSCRGTGSGTLESVPDLASYAPQYLTVDVDPSEPYAGPTLAAKDAKPIAEATALAEGLAERFFVTVYGFQGLGPLNLPRFTHTWALFIHSTDTNLTPVETFAISWDAADGDIGFAQTTEPGRNYTMSETLALAASIPARVRRSPVTEISRTLYNAAVAQYQKIEDARSAGRLSYRMADDTIGRERFRRNQAGAYMNCQHAVTDMLQAQDGALLNTGLMHGFRASDYAYQWLTSPPYGLNRQLRWDHTFAPLLGI